ncbi:MAG: hypothetical protein HPY50_02390 [Firmicutes bacterium]|nr:hypothetical protein [Bacillota bacterium]
MSTGKAAFIANGINPGSSASIQAIDSSVKAYSLNYAVVTVTPEVRLRNGSTDIGWYQVEFKRLPFGGIGDFTSNPCGKWVVTDIRESEPPINGSSFFCPDITPGVTQVFNNYVSALAKGDIQASATYLAGQARKSQEANASILKNGPLFKSMSNLELKPLWGSGNLVASRASYEIDGQSVEATVVFVHLSTGEWKIASIK